MDAHAKATIDAGSAVIVAATVTDILPQISLVLSIIGSTFAIAWYIYRFIQAFKGKKDIT